ncbi:hypothetical protein Poli38472_005197 [Pythium oligandrum]|uniref:Uncharacterized protein n=1 Tax=Pythium oligandrum TaxID=41045 RepID=A0A8K1FIZ3_PYTOL|nr:hypothetical protein Poli38472_005197 [Pythium oligandrum]|eukprot:TMW62579.1 hypothetical protein Poli38472_005197 [Pythium oligandrum]
MIPTIVSPVPVMPPAAEAVLDKVDEVLTATKKDHRSVIELGKWLGADLVAAATASFGVSPFITVVDRAIAENASGKRTLMHGVRELSWSFVQHPIQFVKSKEFMWIWGLYAATYATANTIESVYEWRQVDGQMPKLAGTTLVNMTSVIAKDRAFARMFGVVKPHPFPLTSIGLFAVRDSLTVVSCFHAPQVITAKMSSLGFDENTTRLVAQVGTPIAVQILSTPLHLLGLDLYNHPVAEKAARIQFIQREYFRSTVARVARIGPAFGIGGIGNTSLRKKLRADGSTE